MWEWFIGAILVVVLLPVAFSIFVAVLVDIGRFLGMSLMRLLPGAVGGLVAAIILGIFVAGLLVRAREGGLAKSASRARERAAADRRSRLAVRRPAEDAPVHEPPVVPQDPDPAINDEEQ
jgi:hypothetical protein